jgi:phage shock protein A
MDAKLKLEARLITIRQEREQLKHLLELAEAKKIATKTIKSLDDISKVGDAEMTTISEKIRSQLDRVDAEAEMASSRLQNQIDEVIGVSEIEQQLEERRSRLGLNKE